MMLHNDSTMMTKEEIKQELKSLKKKVKQMKEKFGIPVQPEQEKLYIY